jgi:DNA-binding Lrp family transcriptional regulator
MQDSAKFQSQTPRNDIMLDEADLAFLDALQVNPRASWTLVGGVLEVDPVTAARRWARLCQDGTAWVSVSIGPREAGLLPMAFIEVRCERGTNRDVAAALARRSNVVTVQYMAGAYDLLVIVMAADFAKMSDLLLVDIPSMDGVAGIRSHLVTRQFEATGRWRLGVLGGRQVRRLREAYQPPSVNGARPFGVTDRALFRALSIDGRRTNAEIAGITGLSARTVQRRITTLMSSGEIAFRCDVARSLTGWPSAAVLWLNVPDDRLDEAGRVLGRRPEVRTCVALADNSNLLLSVGLRSIPDLHELLVEILRDAPYARILDRSIVLRQEKLYGRILDPAGRSVEAVPIDPWADRDDR